MIFKPVFFNGGLYYLENGQYIPFRIRAAGGGGGSKSSGGGAAIAPPGSGTTNRIVKFITPTTIGDSLGYDNGVSVGYGTVTPNPASLFQFDSTTQGIQFPRMTTAQRNAIVVGVGNAATFIYNTDTGLFNYWNGVQWLDVDSGTNDWTQGGNTYGATGILGTLDAFDVNFITNNIVAGSINTSQQFVFGNSTVTNGSIVFQNSTNANTLTINSAATSASYALTLPLAQGGASTVLTNDGAGNLSWTSPSATAWMLDGNTVGAEKFIGTIDAFDFPIRTNNIERGRITSTGLWAINGTPVAGTQVLVKSSGTTNATFIAQFLNATPTVMLSLRDDGYISAGLSNGNMTIGFGAGFNDTLSNNTFVGVNSGTSITTGVDNTAFGFNSLNAITTSIHNTAVGSKALSSLTTGSKNTAIGYTALTSLITGDFNTACGMEALNGNVIGSNNVAVGNYALNKATVSLNTAVGSMSMFNTTTGDANVAIGYHTLYSNSTGANNFAGGYSALTSNTTGGNNVSLGEGSMNANTTGSFNTAIGTESLITNISGDGNTALGWQALHNNSIGANNVGLGQRAGYNETGSSKLFIDNDSRTAPTMHSRPLVYGKFAATTPNQSFNVNANSRIGLGFNDNTFGANADYVLGIMNGQTEVTTALTGGEYGSGGGVQIYSVDSTDATATLGLFLNQAVAAEVLVASTNTLKIRINGVQYKILLSTV